MNNKPEVKEVHSREDLVSKVEEGDMIHIITNSQDRKFMVLYKKNGEYYTFIKRRENNPNIINITMCLDDREILFDGCISVKSTNWSLYVDDIKIPSIRNSNDYRKKDEMLKLVGM